MVLDVLKQDYSRI